jgi:hypothetical protein
MIFSDDFDERFRVAWRIEPGVQDPGNPLVEPKYPWEDVVVGCGHGTALKDPIDGKFKAWSSALAGDNKPFVRASESYFRLTYMESDDGIEWRRPMLDICPYPGYEKTNILMDFPSGGRATYASVFIDPEENPREPYEMFVFRDAFFRNENLCVAGFDQQPAKDWLDAYYKYYGLYRYRSNDGIHWRPVEGPINLKSGDTCYIHRDPEFGYVAHHKDTLPAPAGGYVAYDIGSGEVRINFRRTSPDGTHWTDRAIMMAADWRDHQADQIMEVGRYPYRDGFIGLTAVYHAMDQTMDLQFAASADKGVTWWRPMPRKPCLGNAPLGDYGGSMMWPLRTLIEHEGRLYIYYGGLTGIHGDLDMKDQSAIRFNGAFCRASWEIGRLWSATSAEGGMCPGYMTTKKLEGVEGKKLVVNAVTRGEGKVEAELLDESKKVIDGFSREECQAFQGDDKFATITWEANNVCPRDGIHLRLWVTRAFLYGFEWCN